MKFLESQSLTLLFGVILELNIEYGNHNENYFIHNLVSLYKADENSELHLLSVIVRMASCIQVLQHVDLPSWSDSVLHRHVCH